VNRLNIFIDRFLRFFNFLYRRGFFRVFNPYFLKFVRRLVNSRLAVINIFRLSNNMFAVKGNVKILINITRFPRILIIFNFIYMLLDNLSDGLVKFKFFKYVLFLSLNIDGWFLKKSQYIREMINVLRTLTFFFLVVFCEGSDLSLNDISREFD